MSRFRKVSHTLWHCQYHILWTPKYRLRILTGQVAEEVNRCIRAFSEQKGCKVIELNVQIDHVHLIAMVVPKISISEFVGIVKGRTAIRIFNKCRHLKQKPYWGNHFWSRGYCLDTVGLDEEKVRKYVKYQEQKERQEEQKNFKR
ncbi:MAG: IS200/IS605 family transposase [Candidatus Brocadia sp. AMX3]|nr:IS200/IS605 family transposase [Candidatus Brocadia sp.]MCE7912957.1 IS200/IS605 family transposase [Candidatus Brocadia sp. AMX3]